MSTEIATAYISLVPSMQGTQRNIAKEMGAVEAAASKSGDSAGSKWGRGLQTGVKAATAAATAVVAAGGVAMGVALTKGLGRLNAIDTAKAKLRGLGNDSDTVSAIMKNALTSVKGTAYGLDEAATTAAGAVAAGIKPGEQLEATLKTVANVAASTGRGMDEMGAVFNQVAAGGKAYTMQIKQIAYAGLPIWQKLSEVLGTTTDEVQNMASKGQIDFATFQKAAELAAGTVAVEMGKTLPGAIQNLWAAVSRIGANLWKGLELDDGTYTGIYSKLTALVTAITGALEPVEAMASRVGNVVGNVLGPAFDWVTARLEAFAAASDTVGARLKPIMSAVAPLGAMFLALGAGGLASVITKLGPLAGLLGPLPKLLGAIGGPIGIAVAGLGALSAVDPQQMMGGFTQILGALPGLFDTISQTIIKFTVAVVPDLVSGLSANLPILIQGVLRVLGTVIHQIGQLLPTLIQAGVLLFQGLLRSLVQVLPSLIQGLIGLVQQLVPTLLSLVPTLVQGALMLFHGIVQALTQIVEPLMQGVLALLPVLVETLVALIPQLIEGALTLFTALIDALVLVVPPLLEGILALLPEIIGALVEMIPGLIDGAVQLFVGIIQALPIIIPQLISAVIDLIPVIVDALLSAIDGLIQGAVALFTGILEALPIIIPDLIDAVIELVPQIVTALVTEGVPALFQAGKDIISGLIDGIGDMASGAVEAVTNLGSSVLGGIKSFFGISSPSKVMAEIGGFLDAGLAGGIGKGAGSVAAMAAMAKQVTAVTSALRASVTATANAVAVQVNRIIQSLRSLMSMMSGAFQASVSGQLTNLARLFQTLLPNAATQMVALMQKSLGGLGSWFGTTFKNTLTSAIRAIQAAFLAVPGAVATSWARLRSGTGAPTNFVISAVYMSGIRAAVNAITSAAGVKMSMPSVKTVAYAGGGVLPGYTPGRDIYDFYNPQVGTLRLGGGEGILRPEVVKALGAGTINAWNASRGRDVHAFAGGGILDFLTKGTTGWSVNANQSDFLAALFGDIKGGMKALVTDPAREYGARAGGGQWGSGAGGSMANLGGAIAAALAAKVKAAQPEEGLPAGTVTGGPVGAFNPIGWQAMSRIIKAAFPSARITSAYRPGNGPSMHNFGRAVDIAGGNMTQIAEWLLRTFPNAYQVLHSPLGARNIWWAGQRGMPPANLMSTHYDHVHWAMKTGGLIPSITPNLYDNGGWLMPGLHITENKSGKPEPVLTDSQWSALRDGGLGPGSVLRVEAESADGLVHLMDLRVKRAEAASVFSAPALLSQVGTGLVGV